MADSGRKRILVLGGGSGGLELVSALAPGGRFDVTLVDQVSSHLWKPRLHEFAAGTVNSSLAEISFYVLGDFRGFRFEQGRVESIDRGARRVRVAPPAPRPAGRQATPRDLDFDACVVALGGVTTDFGIPGVAEHAVRLDSRQDAEAFRGRFIAAMIGARTTEVPADIVIVGSGATGTELAAHLRLAERAFYEPHERHRAGRHLRITILEGADELMPGSAPELRQAVAERLASLDIAVRTGASVAGVGERDVTTKDGTVHAADIVVWAGGLVGHPVLEHLADFELDKRGRILVDERLRSSVDPRVFVLGDAASLTPEGAKAPLPPTAQCASQQAAYLAQNLPAMLEAREAPPFRFSNKGSLVSLGRAGSVGLIGRRRRDDILVDGHFAAAAYDALQRQHQWAVLGPVRGSVAILADWLSPTKGPALKLHG
ncbi:NAD(P)/FAD-dependent oxidoreductase [Antarcticirhabdus aurantiaca]|uniref:FAD-dependent oxidoreductase n=1 Tax=Antarcticirhabdus aurantiaca TaxID=2606717 RepID=A0ACD4NS47_9HYPH|nr:FAD-dependent oxidoreductase [Antarcticirhabdus aurantiaca]WAJ29582.1 FAD-dependent oxidoreductase [Jeongeuplla avenae]